MASLLNSPLASRFSAFPAFPGPQGTSSSYRTRLIWLVLALVSIWAALGLSWTPEAVPTRAWKKVLGATVGGQDEWQGMHVAVEEIAGYHDEVIGGFLATLKSMNVRTTLFRNRMRWDYDKAIASFYDRAPVPWDDIFERLKNEDPAERIDLVISTTCVVTFQWNHEKLIEVWRNRKTKFKLGCVIHNGLEEFFMPALKEWAATGAMSVIFLSPHTCAYTTGQMSWLNIVPNHAEQFIYDDFANYVFVPIFPVASLSEALARPRNRKVSSAVVQGGMNPGRRSYGILLEDLEKSLRNDPLTWGFAINATGDGIDPIPSADPFDLKIVGEGELELPSLLKGMVTLHSRLAYSEFYEEIAKTDLLLPDFAQSFYYGSSASSSIPAALIGRTHILATRSLLNHYKYLDSRAVILREASTPAIEAIYNLRKHGRTWSSEKRSAYGAGSALQSNVDLPRRHRKRNPLRKLAGLFLTGSESAQAQDLAAASWPPAPEWAYEQKIEELDRHNIKTMSALLSGVQPSLLSSFCQGMFYSPSDA